LETSAGRREGTLRDLVTQLELAPCALLAIDRDGQVAFANADARALAAHLDDLQLAIEGQEPLAELLDEDEVAVEPAIRAGRRLSITRSFERPDGAELWLSVDIVPLGEGASAMCALRDVTEIREREEELSHQALHDSLTGLPNRRFTEEQLGLALARARRGGGGVGVVFVDIDNFKGVNDDLGHAAGDEVLIEFAERLAGAVRETDAIGRMAGRAPLVARRGGDEFVLVLGDLPASCADLISKVIERVEAALAKPFDVSGRKLDISASFGAAAHPYDSHDQGMLVELANAAMRAAKRRRREVRFSEPSDAG
jgi:diguanylate cyclase (GGDEF)-like protein